MWLRMKNLARPTITILGSSNYGARKLVGGWCEDANAPKLTLGASQLGMRANRPPVSGERFGGAGRDCHR